MGKNLSIIFSLISPESLASLVEETYNLSNISCKLIRVGDNDNYLILSGNDKYVLRMYKREKYWLKSESDYFFEMEWLNHLKQNSCSISYPIQRKDKQYIGHLEAPEGIRFFALFSFAEGEENPITYQRAYLLGKEIGKVHIASNKFKSSHSRLTMDLEFLIDQPVQLINNHFGEFRKSEQAKLVTLAAELKKQISNLNLQGDAWGVIGGDFHGYNQHFDERDNPTLFDFDLCGYGWRAYDLAVFRWLQVSDFDVVRNYFQALIRGRLLLWKKFIQGYQTIRKLSSDELKVIPLFVRVRQIWLMGSYIASPNPTLTMNDNWWDSGFRKLFKDFQ